MFGRVRKIISKIAFWFPPPEGHKDEGYLFLPEPKEKPATRAAAVLHPASAAPPAGRRVLPVHSVLLIGTGGSREIGLALREAGMKVTSEDDMLRAEKLLRRSAFDALIVDMDIQERGLMSLMRILRRSDSKKAFFIVIAQSAGAAEHELADRIGADALWSKAGLQNTILGSLEAVNADRSARASMTAQSP